MDGWMDRLKQSNLCQGEVNQASCVVKNQTSDFLMISGHGNLASDWFIPFKSSLNVFIINIFTCWSAETEHRLTGCVTPSNSCSQAWTEGRGLQECAGKGKQYKLFVLKAEHREMLVTCYFFFSSFHFPFCHWSDFVCSSGGILWHIRLQI